MLGNCIGDDVELWGECYPINLTELDLIGNKLSGEIPSAIGTLINLRTIRIDQNQLVGEIPPEIGNLTKLETLYLNYNQLSGQIPQEIWTLTNLRVLSLSDNKLEGEIPTEILNLENLYSFRVSNNQLSGVFPEDICSMGNELNYSMYIDIRDNCFSAPFPSCVQEENSFFIDNQKISDVCGDCDNCETCDNENSNDCIQDCDGNWGGTNFSCDIEDCTGNLGGMDFLCNENDCRDPLNCSDCYGCEDNCCPNYCDANYYYYDYGCSNTFCQSGGQSDFCPNGCTEDGCLVTDCAGVLGGSTVEDCAGVCGGTHEDSDCGTVNDIDGNTYKTIKIGGQDWMAENLKTTHYRNGEALDYSYYDDNPSESETYGSLYDWYTVIDDRGMCPEVWHVPSDEEWQELELFLGMDVSEVSQSGSRGTNEGSKLAGIPEFWHDGADNMPSDLVSDSEFGTSGFNAIPGGKRGISDGGYSHMGTTAYFWTSSGWGNDFAYHRKLYSANLDIDRYGSDKFSGYSIRCLKD